MIKNLKFFLIGRNKPLLNFEKKFTYFVHDFSKNIFTKQKLNIDVLFHFIGNHRSTEKDDIYNGNLVPLSNVLNSKKIKF